MLEYDEDRDYNPKGTCIGKTKAGWEALFIAMREDGQAMPNGTPIPGNEMISAVLDLLIEGAGLHECSRHPGHYLSGPKRRKT